MNPIDFLIYTCCPVQLIFSSLGRLMDGSSDLCCTIPHCDHRPIVVNATVMPLSGYFGFKFSTEELCYLSSPRALAAIPHVFSCSVTNERLSEAITPLAMLLEGMQTPCTQGLEK